MRKCHMNMIKTTLYRVGLLGARLARKAACNLPIFTNVLKCTIWTKGKPSCLSAASLTDYKAKTKVPLKELQFNEWNAQKRTRFY